MPSANFPALNTLTKALANRKAVLFVGAGISASCGVPLWKSLLLKCIEKAKQSDSGQLGLIEQSVETGDFPVAAELLQRRVTDATLSEYLYDIIEPYTSAEPHEVLRTLARMPFSLVITTNFDNLLEAAHGPNVKTFTWQDHTDILRAIQNRVKVIIKMHGSLNTSSSIIFTKGAYSRLTYRQAAFSECFKTLLLLRTLLFVGHSLKDPDLLHLIETVKAVFGESFGPHYAILPEDETDQEYAEYVKNQYGIIILPCPVGPRENTKWPLYYQNLINLLRDIDGSSLSQRHEWRSYKLASESHLSRYQEVQGLLAHCVSSTGSLRGDVCFVQNGVIQRVLRTNTFPQTTSLPKLITHQSVIGSVFLRRSADNDYLVINDIVRASEELRVQDAHNSRYVECDGRARSELAVPIVSDGRRVGVLNLESTSPNWYSRFYIQFAREVADRMGWVFYETERRQAIGDRLLPLHKSPGSFKTLLFMSRVVKRAQLKTVLYHIDYVKGEFTGSSTELLQDEHIIYKFGERSLPNAVLSAKRPVVIKNAALEAKNEHGLINARGVLQLGISGRVYAFPVRVAGLIASVFVAWVHKKSGFVEIAAFRALKMATLLANDVTPNLGSAERFFRHVDSELDKFDEAELESPASLAAAGLTNDFVATMLSSLTDPSVGLKRTRLWLCENMGDKGSCARFRCSHSFTSAEASRLQVNEIGSFVGVKSFGNDPYTQYTADRSGHDREARWQHWSMFGEPDPNCTQLDKDPDGSWLVAPLLVKAVFKGFISADNHLWDESRGKAVAQTVDDDRARFQALALDVVADILNGIAESLV